MKSFAAIVAVAATAAAVLLSAAAAGATPPGENGRIAYRLYLNEAQTRAAILTIKPNGSGKRWVTHPARRILHLVPDWSADGRWIAFIRTRYSRGGPGSVRFRNRPHILRIHPNGTGRSKDLSTSCTDPCRWHDDPAWSPNGRHIAFNGYFKGGAVDVMIMRPDGTHVRHITHHPSGHNSDFVPQWAPSGKRLVFGRYNGRRDKSAIFTIRRNGTGLRRLTPWRLDVEGEPDWSPNGRWIMFKDGGVCLMHPNGEDRHCITDTNGGAVEWGSGSFSPDGTKIVYSRTGGVGPAGSFDVFRMNLDGSGLVNVTQTAASDGAPDWGPRRD